MEELIFFAIIIVFSILDSIARTRKKRQQAQAPGAPSRVPSELEDEEIESYDSDPSYDDRSRLPRWEPKTLPEYTAPYGAKKGPSGTPAKSSEGMIPADIWEEIAGLTRGRLPEPRAEPQRPLEIEPIPPRPVQAHRVHRAHAGYGTDPSSRARSEQDGLDPLRKTLSRDASAVRRQLRSQKRSALRQAVLLQEVLGPPAAARPERFLE